MMTPSFKIHDCCDVHVTCDSCGDHRHICKSGYEDLRDARRRAVREFRCSCEKDLSQKRGSAP
jgi:hypothetical protein